VSSYLILFLSQFAVVFLLGFQSQSIRDNRYVAAMIGSCLIGASQLFQWKMMPKASPSEMAVWLMAGPLAIVSAMWLHPKVFRIWKK
jgi:hypothetical protein